MNQTDVPIIGPFGASHPLRVSCDCPVEIDQNVEFGQHGGGDLVEVLIKCAENPRDAPVEITWSWPLGDGQIVWSPGRVGLPADWASQRRVTPMRGAPTAAVVAPDDTALCTLSLGTSVRGTDLAVGVREETAEVTIQIRVDDVESDPSAGGFPYSFWLRLDLRRRHLSSALTAVTDAWLTELGSRNLAVPNMAHEAAYSTWYSNHQHISAAAVEHLAEAAAGAGLRAIIVDDGWHTVNRERGYAFCGDWEPNPETFPDMTAHVNAVHEIGLAYLLWFAPPLIGEESAAWARLKDKTLAEAPGLNCHVLDPRYADVRDHLTSCCVRAISEWGMDGLKIDFVDTWANYDGPAAPGMDCDTVSEGVERLLAAIRDGVLAVRDDALIEFRQGYVSPRLWPYGTILRAGDCPMDVIQNRIRTVDLRLLAGDRAIHADMIMWHPDATPEQVAAQLTASLFATPQISMDPSTLSPLHTRVLRFWLDLMRRYRPALLHGVLTPSRRDAGYTQVRSTDKHVTVVACYADAQVVLDDEWPEETLIVNAGPFDELIVRSSHSTDRVLTILTCEGEKSSEESITIAQGLTAIRVPRSGVARFTQTRETA